MSQGSCLQEIGWGGVRVMVAAIFANNMPLAFVTLTKFPLFAVTEKLL